MAERTIGFVGFGELAATVSRSLGDRGFGRLVLGPGRSPATLERASAGDVAAVDAAELCARADLVLSLVPPAHALPVAESLAPSLERAGRPVVFVDANSIAPETARAIAGVIAGAGGRFADGTFHVFPRSGAPRLYVCGPAAAEIGWLAGPGLELYDLGPEIGAAGRLKMCLSLIRKTSIALWLAALAEAERAGLSEAVARELSCSEEPMAQSHVFEAFAGLAERRKLTARAARWIGEMQEVARTFPEGPARGLGDAARAVFELLAQVSDPELDRSDVDSLRRLLEAAGAPEEG